MSNINRPDFDPSMSVEEFDRHYWYKEELKQICTRHRLSAHGTKAELEERIRLFLTGQVVHDQRKKQSSIRKGTPQKEITLKTRLIPDGFKFNQQARDFFKSYYNVSKFSFTKDMAAALREAEKRGDHDMTVADLIQIYEEGKHIQKKNNANDSAEEKTYQWNRFVQDFNRDPKTKGLTSKMKVAALLWQYVKNNPGPKVYHTDLLKKFEKEVHAIMEGKGNESI